MGCLMNHIINAGDSLVELIYKLLRRLFVRTVYIQFHLELGMFVVKADHGDTNYQISATVTDSEGNEVESTDVDWEVLSDNESCVSIIPDDDSDPTTGKVHFGSPGLANLNITAKSNGVILGSFGAQFTVTAGDPAAITGATIAFEGIEEAPEPEPEV